MKRPSAKRLACGERTSSAPCFFRKKRRKKIFPGIFPEYLFFFVTLQKFSRVWKTCKKKRFLLIIGLSDTSTIFVTCRLCTAESVALYACTFV